MARCLLTGSRVATVSDALAFRLWRPGICRSVSFGDDLSLPATDATRLARVCSGQPTKIIHETFLIYVRECSACPFFSDRHHRSNRGWGTDSICHLWVIHFYEIFLSVPLQIFCPLDVPQENRYLRDMSTHRKLICIILSIFERWPRIIISHLIHYTFIRHHNVY